MPISFRSATPFIAALVLLASEATAQSFGELTQIAASRHEARVTFPRERGQPWGWPASEGTYIAGFQWSFGGPGVHGYWTVDLEARPDSNEARLFPSLDALIASARLRLCRAGGMIASCAPVLGSARVEDGRVVIELRDSLAIAEMFGLRPPRRTISRFSPSGAAIEFDSARVDYTAPQIAEPSDSLRAWVVERRRLDEKNGTHASRAIRVRPSRGWGDTLWVTLGDTLDVTLDESTCSGDVCTGSSGYRAWGDSGWVFADSTILAPVRTPAPPPASIAPRPSGQLREVIVEVRLQPLPARRVASRLGATTIHVGGLKPYEDTARVASPPPRALTQVVIVRPRVARVVIHPRPDTVYVGSEPWFTADAFDAAGGLLVRAPVQIAYPDSGLRVRRRWYESVNTGLPPGGRRRVVATLDGVADTITVFVADTTKR